MVGQNYNPKHKGAIDVAGRTVDKTPRLASNASSPVKKRGFFSKATFALDKAGRKGGKLLVKGVRKLPGGIKAGAKAQGAFRTSYYNRRKLGLERKENVIKHKANISGLRTQRAQSRADLLEAKLKQEQIKRQARLERSLGKTGSSGVPRHDLYGKTSRVPQKLKKQPGFFD